MLFVRKNFFVLCGSFFTCFIKEIYILFCWSIRTTFDKHLHRFAQNRVKSKLNFVKK